MKKIVSIILAAALSLSVFMPATAATDAKVVTPSIASISFDRDSTGFAWLHFVMRGSFKNNSKYTAQINKVTVNADVNVEGVNGLESFKDTLTVTPDNPGETFQGVGGMAAQVASSIPKTVAAGKKAEFVTCAIQESIKVTETLPPETYKNTTVTVDYTLFAKTKKVVKLYKKNSAKSKVLVKKVKKGAKVEVVSPKAVKGFVKVKASKKTGYIQATALKAA